METLPQIGSNGVFVLASPFDKSIVEKRSYTCIAVRRLDEVINTGTDPYTTYYLQPYNLSEALYQRDLAAGVSICTLRAEGNTNVYVPSSYIKSFPIMGGVAYRVLGLGLNLGSIPEQLDLSPLKTKLADLVSSVLGVDPRVTEISLGQVENLTQDEHDRYESARKARITDRETDFARANRLAAENSSMKQKIKVLEDYILANHIQTSP